MSAAARRVALLVVMATVVSVRSAGSQRLAGVWRDGLPVHLVRLELRQDVKSDRVTGTLSLFGMNSAVEGSARGDTFEIQSIGGQRGAANIVKVSGRLDGDALVLTIAERGEVPTNVRLKRAGDAKTRADAPTRDGSVGDSQHGLAELATSARSRLGGLGAAVRSAVPGNGNARDQYDGSWEFVSDDEDYRERMELSVSGASIRGTFTAVRRGHFSGRTTTEAALQVDGEVRSDRADLHFVDPATGNAVQGTAHRRGAYLILRGGGRETGYARPGTPLVRPIDGSPEATAFLNTVNGRVYQVSSTASGRNASVGGRTRLALCSTGEIAYDVSNLASAAGPSFGETMDLGGSTSRRGRWTVVLYAGAPAVMARWQGTGTSYSLTAYFALRPSPDGQTVELNGTRLPAIGRC